MKFSWGTLWKNLAVLILVFIILYVLCTTLLLTLFYAIFDDRAPGVSSLTLMIIWPVVSFSFMYRLKLNDEEARREFLHSIEGVDFDVSVYKKSMMKDPVFRGELLAGAIAIALFGFLMPFFIIFDIIAYLIFNTWANISIRRRWAAERLRK